jgi:2-(1,2-epoxy-1,2-dihydrophenyl)acetyl-CoA isomerase
MFSYLTYALADGIARITLARPEMLNALSAKVGVELTAALERAEAEGARVVVLAGEGRAFSAGGDLSEPFPTKPEQAHSALLDLQGPIRKIAQMPVPVIAAVQGAVAGGGVGVALAADMVVATRSAYFMLAFVHVGLAPEMGSAWLVAKSVGRARALELALLGDKLPAEKALDWGLIARVVDDDALTAEVDALAARLAKGPPLSLKAIRQEIDQALTGTLEEMFAMEEQVAPVLATSRDCHEGVAAFMERRPAKFEGK